MDIEFLGDSNDEFDISDYYTKGHVNKQDFIDELLEIIGCDYDENEIATDDIQYKYARWIPNPSYEDVSDILDESSTPKKDYFPITIYEV